MKIIPHDNLFRTLVESDDGQSQYLVDLESFWGNGQCDCRDFMCRKQPFLSKPVSQGGMRTTDEHDDSLRCKHIRFARQRLGNTLINTIINERQTKTAKGSVDPCEG